jgi:hypothetical protein
MVCFPGEGIVFTAQHHGAWDYFLFMFLFYFAFAPILLPAMGNEGASGMVLVSLARRRVKPHLLFQFRMLCQMPNVLFFFHEFATMA